jgi:hypothetical protein
MKQFNPGVQYKNIEDVGHEIQLLVPEYKKEIALFRNGYLPNQTLLKDAKSKQVKFGADYLEKWLVDFNRTHGNIKKFEEKKVSN